MALAALLVPLAIRLARRTGFMDVPAGYKGHARTTPYLGGVAVVGAIAVSVLVLGVGNSRFAALLIWGLVMFVVGTVDDRINLNPLVRLVIEVAGAGALWHYGIGWDVFGSDVLNVALTILWVVGLVNAFNLMDNMDGAASTVAGVSAAGFAIAAIVGGDMTLAVLGLTIAGACCGFLPYNLSKPARQFLGDGGSMPLGFLVAGGVMAAPMSSELGWAGLLAAAPIAGLPILDTTLVVISRRRGGRPILSGGRDHLTHRLRSRLGSPQLVAVCLATIQGGLCLATILLAQAGRAPVAAMAVAYVMAALAAIYTLESRFSVTVAGSAASGPYGVVPGGPTDAPTGSAVPERAAA
jgi:UDP-GlcNAc:undecaprenyl-phosphate GlcNAc-1-phosphate transferase